MTKKKILLVGYSGHANFGDDLLLYQAYEQFKNIADVSIWSGVEKEHSAYLERWFPSATVFRSKRLGFAEFIKYEKILYIGGGVFFDYMREYPVKTYIRKILACYYNYTLAKLLGVRFAGIGIGLGPFMSSRAKKINEVCLRNFDFMTLRDEDSMIIASTYDVRTLFYKGFDLSFFSINLLGMISSVNYKPTQSILVCPRKFPHETNGELYHDTLINWCKSKQVVGIMVLVLGLQKNHDEPILERYKDAGIPTEMWNPSKMGIKDIFTLFAVQDLIVSARMHGVYVAGMVGTPCIGINVHPKVKDAASILEKAVSIEPAFTEEHLEDAIAALAHTQKDNNFRAFTESAENDYARVENWIKDL